LSGDHGGLDAGSKTEEAKGLSSDRSTSLERGGREKGGRVTRQKRGKREVAIMYSSHCKEEREERHIAKLSADAKEGRGERERVGQERKVVQRVR